MESANNITHAELAPYCHHIHICIVFPAVATLSLLTKNQSHFVIQAIWSLKAKFLFLLRFILWSGKMIIKQKKTRTQYTIPYRQIVSMFSASARQWQLAGEISVFDFIYDRQLCASWRKSITNSETLATTEDSMEKWGRNSGLPLRKQSRIVNKQQTRTHSRGME